MRQTVKRDKHNEIAQQRARKSATYRKTFGRTPHQIDLALLVREMRRKSRVDSGGARQEGWHHAVCDCPP